MNGFPLFRIAAFTVMQAGISTLIAAAIGLAAAFFTARRMFPLRRFLLSLASVPLCLPSLIMALGYVSFFGRSGSANKLLMTVFAAEDPPLTFLYTFAGLVILQGFYNFPLVMATVCSIWSRLPQEEPDAARLLGAGEVRIFCSITLRQLAGALVSACIPVFLFCFFSFMIVLLFGGIGCTTLEVELYHAAKSQLDFSRARDIALLETCTALLVVTAYSYVSERKAKCGLCSTPRLRMKLHGALERACFSLFSLLVALFFLAPLFGIVWNAVTSAKGALTLQTIARVVTGKSFFSALCGTVLTASATGILCALLAFCYAALLRSFENTVAALSACTALARVQRRFVAVASFALRIVPLVPMAVSSVVLGVFLLRLVRRGNTVLLVCAQTALFWPFAFRQIYAQLAKIPPATVDAARLFAKRPLQTVFGIYLPFSARGIVRAAGFCFAMSAGDTTLPLVLAVPEFNTLSLLTYRFAGAYRFHEACAAGLLLAVLCAGVFVLANAARMERRK